MSLKHRAVLTAKAGKNGPRITPAQWGVVMFIRNRTTCTVKDIAQTFSITSSAATQLVDGLVKSGYVKRQTDAKDRRAVALTLSKTMRDHVAAMKRMATREFMRLFKVLSEKEFNQYCALSRKIVQGLSRRTLHQRS